MNVIINRITFGTSHEDKIIFKIVSRLHYEVVHYYLLPLLAKRELGLDSTGFGLLLGSFGGESVVILPKLLPKASVESLITVSIALLAIVTFTMGYVQDFVTLCIVMSIGGAEAPQKKHTV